MKIKEYVQKYDPQNQFDVLINSYQQIEYAWKNELSITGIDIKDINNIIVSGLGGSAISADLLRNFIADELTVPYAVNRNYNLPKYADEKTLFIASSYSGNTEETISALNEAIKSNCKIICISTGGKITEIAEANSIYNIKLLKGFQPRYALGLSFFSLLKLFQHLKLISDQSDLVEKIRLIWQQKGLLYSAEDNHAVAISKSLIGFIPVIYSVSDSTNSVGYRFKCQLNENSKLHAFHHEVPEMNHNEIIGWESYQEKIFHAKVINIKDDSYHPQTKKRFSILKELFEKAGVEIIDLKSNEDNFKVRLLDLIYLSDWISYYTGVLRGYDPSEIDNIHTLKEKLS
ncbi:MAG: bifunctional phosphoglucose/phosphomannose isomerase [Ignavibacterium sp.]|jgi:glucose/mannose-6-phosphate isomerase|nr:bifunctional phosphoglucose/phosphomannose isomerase [Ignavibacterium sp.]